MKEDWKHLLSGEFQKPYYQELMQFLDTEYKTKKILPDRSEIFNAFCYTSHKNAKICIIGQDPYNTPGYPNGLSFSVNDGVPIPKSLQNIYKELLSDLRCYIPNTGNLTKWAVSGGCIMLNTVLTVEAGVKKANSHKGKGWEKFTDEVIRLLNQKEEPMVFMLWGENAKKKKKLITNPIHLVLESSHPSGLSCYKGFNGSKPFSKANEFLVANGREPVDWQIENVQ